MDIPEVIKDLQAIEFKHRRRVWRPFMEKYNCKRIVEIGVFRAENFRRMIEHGPELAVAVDAWIDDGVIARNDAAFSQEKLNKMHDDFIVEMKDKPFVKTYREYSVDAAKHFPDNYFDLIFIDADHSYEGCMSDIVAWYPKVRSGGYITGDDYSRYRAVRTGVVFKVIEAVNDFFNPKNLTIYELPRHGWAVIKP
jgi:hypothetical protein